MLRGRKRGEVRSVGKPDVDPTSWIAILGRRDEPTDALEDYCIWLGRALTGHGRTLELVRVSWSERGWPAALLWLWRESSSWRNQWVLAQYTALAWSRRGFPAGFLLVLGVLRIRRARCAVVFHDVQAYGGQRPIDRLRRACQQWVMRMAGRWAERSILTVPTEQVRWLPRNATNAAFIPVGANLSGASAVIGADRTSRQAPRSVAVYGVTGGAGVAREVADIAYAVRQAKSRVGELRLIVLGRNSTEAEPALRRALADSGVDVQILGLLAEEQVASALARADVLLFVRGGISSRRGSAIAAIACGLPVVGYRGEETASPITQAGLVLAPQDDREALATALIRVLTENRLRQELSEKSKEAHRQYFSWEAISGSFLKALEDEEG